MGLMPVRETWLLHYFGGFFVEVVLKQKSGMYGLVLVGQHRLFRQSCFRRGHHLEIVEPRHRVSGVPGGVGMRLGPPVDLKSRCSSSRRQYRPGQR